jgi:hypothetical protein
LNRTNLRRRRKMAKARKRFKNITTRLQVIYDETGDKKEVVPGGTIILDEAWGRKFARVLAPVEAKKTSK